MTLLLKPAVAEEPLLVVVDVDAEEPPEDLVEPVGSDAGAVVLSDGLAVWEGVKPDKALPLLEGRDWAREGVSGEQLYRHTFGHFRWTRRIVTMSPPHFVGRLNDVFNKQGGRWVKGRSSPIGMLP